MCIIQQPLLPMVLDFGTAVTNAVSAGAWHDPTADSALRAATAGPALCPGRQGEQLHAPPSHAPGGTALVLFQE